MTTAKEPRKRLERKCECGAPKWKHSAGVGVCIEPRCACGVFRPAPKPRKRPETPEQKARELAKAAGLKFWLVNESGFWVRKKRLGPTSTSTVFATDEEIALWRALARERGVRFR